jgi:hypothetical protein
MYASFGNPSAAVREQYRACLMALTQGSREICRTRMAYREGSQLYAQAYARLKDLKPIDEAFLAKAAAWKDECGMMRLALSIKTSAFTARSASIIPRGRNSWWCVTEGEKPGPCMRRPGLSRAPTRAMATAMSRLSVPAASSRRESVFSGKHWLCFTGRIVPGRGQGSVAKLELKFDTSVAAPLVAEQVQWTCPGKPAVIFQEKIFEALFQNPKFRLFLDYQKKRRPDSHSG